MYLLLCQDNDGSCYGGLITQLVLCQIDNVPRVIGCCDDVARDVGGCADVARLISGCANVARLTKL